MKLSWALSWVVDDITDACDLRKKMILYDFQTIAPGVRRPEGWNYKRPGKIALTETLCPCQRGTESPAFAPSQSTGETALHQPIPPPLACELQQYPRPTVPGPRLSEFAGEGPVLPLLVPLLHPLRWAEAPVRLLVELALVRLRVLLGRAAVELVIPCIAVSDLAVSTATGAVHWIAGTGVAYVSASSW